MGKSKTVVDSPSAIKERHEESLENDDTNVLALDDTMGTLNAILKELKIMNIHLSLITDTEIKKYEVD